MEEMISGGLGVDGQTTVRNDLYGVLREFPHT